MSGGGGGGCALDIEVYFLMDGAYNAGFSPRWKVNETDSIQRFVRQLQGWVGMLVHLYD